MRRIIITETDAGQWIAETSSGVRTTGATLQSAISKLLPFPLSDSAKQGELIVLVNVFAGIKPTSTGQIVNGQAGA